MRNVWARKAASFSGIRPTGRAHLGNYLGAFKNYVALQDDYECVYCIVDLHALTTVEDTLNLKQNTYDMALDLLAVGIRPEETILFVQSHVPQVTELHTILSMVTPLGKLTDLPTFKEKVRQNPNNVNYGLVGYPVLMSGRHRALQVGPRAGGHRPGAAHRVCPRDRPLLQLSLQHQCADRAADEERRSPQGARHRRQGEDGQEPEQPHRTGRHTRRDPQRVMMMVTDPQRMKRTDPGNPDVCNVFTMHKVFTPQEDVEMINVECRRAGIGCVDCKKRFAENLNKALEPFRAKRAELAAQTGPGSSHARGRRPAPGPSPKRRCEEVRAAVQLP